MPEHNGGGEMTLGEWIKTRSDDELAAFFTELLWAYRSAIIKALQAKGIIGAVEFVDIPVLSKAAHLKWIKQLIGGGDHE